MRTRSLIFSASPLLALALLLSSAGAVALPIQLAPSFAGWSDIDRGNNLELLDQDAIAGTEEIRWGGQVSTLQKSGYGFEANSGHYDYPLAEPLLLGWFTHFNQTIAPGTSIRGATLNLEVLITIDGTAPVSVPIDIGFRHRETTNDCTTSPDCANDLIDVSGSFAAPLQIGATGFVLEQIAFWLDGSAVSRFSTVEESENRAALVATLRPTSVPEPGTLMLLAAGLGLLIMGRKSTARA